MSEEKGKRFNSGKLRWRNFPLFLMKPLAQVGHYGETKYETFNFLKGMSVQDCMDCLYRHLEKIENPMESDIDDESKCHHLAHVAWNALVALYFINTRSDLDDRYKVKLQKKEEVKVVEKVKPKFVVGDLVQPETGEEVFSVVGNYYDMDLKLLVFIQDKMGKVFAVDASMYKLCNNVEKIQNASY